jgi:hypothetical protein
MSFEVEDNNGKLKKRRVIKFLQAEKHKLLSRSLKRMERKKNRIF